jgi:hypothetical protein
VPKIIMPAPRNRARYARHAKQRRVDLQHVAAPGGWRRSDDAVNPKNRAALADRVGKAAAAALAAQGYVRPIDVLVGIGWLDAGELERWRRGQIDYLERAVHANLKRISEALQLFCHWAAAKELFASSTAYVARRPGRQTLRFSKSGNPVIEGLYRTHWVSPELLQKKRERLAEKAALLAALRRPPSPCR